MTPKNSITCFMLFMFFSNAFFCQNKLLKQAIKNETQKYATNKEFEKIKNFLYENQWDSILTNTLQENYQTKELKDYYKFFRGLSFKKKGIFKEAEKEFSFVSKKFFFQTYIKSCLARFEIKKRNYKKALAYYKLIQSVDVNTITYLTPSNITQNIGTCYFLLKDYNKAENYLLRALKEHKKNNDTTKLISGYINIANLYNHQKKKKAVFIYFKKAYELTKKTGSFDLKRKTAKNMALLEENRNNYKKALIYRKEMENWKDSLNNQNKIWEVAQVEKNFAVKEKQKEVDLLQIENKLKETERNLFLYTAIGLLTLLTIGIYFYREKIKSNKIIAIQKENLNTLNDTKDKLFSIVSHDLRSSVNALKTSNANLLDNLASKNLTILEDLLQKNSTIVNGAYSLLDNLLNWALLQTEQGYFSIDKLRLFFITEQVAYNFKPLFIQKELSFENTITKKDIIFADQESLKIILRNLLDNAIKFSKPNGNIKVYSKNTSKEYCDLIIEDNGLGMSEATRLKLLSDSKLLSKKENNDIIGTGLGIQLCKSMIMKNNGKFFIKSELGKGTQMIVSLPKTFTNGHN